MAIMLFMFLIDFVVLFGPPIAVCVVEHYELKSLRPCVTELEVSPASFEGSGLEVSP